MLTDLYSRIRAFVARSIVEEELEDELRFHLDSAVDKDVAAGFSRSEAARRARLEWGGLEQLKESCRDVRGIQLIDNVSRDVRDGFRTLCRTPTFTIISLLTLGFTTAAVATVLTLWYTRDW